MTEAHKEGRVQINGSFVKASVREGVQTFIAPVVGVVNAVVRGPGSDHSLVEQKRSRDERPE